MRMVIRLPDDRRRASGAIGFLSGRSVSEVSESLFSMLFCDLGECYPGAGAMRPDWKPHSITTIACSSHANASSSVVSTSVVARLLSRWFSDEGKTVERR